MTEPPRILADPAATAFERGLLASWASEAPSSDARARAVALAGIGAVAAATIGGVASAAAPKAAAFGLSGAAKLWIAGLMLFTSALVSVAIVATSGSPSAPANVAVPAVTNARAPAIAMTRGAAAAPGAASEPASLSPADLPEAPTVATPSPVAAPSAPRPQRSVAAATGSLSEEIASFERARSSLESGDVEQAVALLDGYEKRYPTGAFWQEAEVLRVKALTAKGDVSGARRAGERFLAANPTSPHAPRIRAILESSDP